MKILVALLLSLVSSFAVAVDTYVATTGNDANDCLSSANACLTLQRGADAAVGCDAAYTCVHGSNSAVGNVNVANGTYSAGVNLVYYKVLNVIGNCADNTQVTISGSNKVLFQAQDGAILTVKCFTVSGTGSVGFASRQMAIIDHDKIRFTGTMSVHFAANEQSKINSLGSVTVAGNAIYHVSVSGLSTVSHGGVITLTGGVPAFDAFIYAVQRGLALINTATISGTATGRSYINDSSLIVRGSVTIPGGTIADVCQNGCIVE